MNEQRLTIEEAVDTIDSLLNEAERKFHAKYKRYPSLLEERDYVLLRECINISKWREYYSHLYGKPKIPVFDFGHRLLIQFFRRNGFFNGYGRDRNDAFNGIMGRVCYHYPNREIEFRIQSLEKLEKKKRKFLPNDWKLFIETLRKIGSSRYDSEGRRIPPVCALVNLQKSDPEAYNIGDSLAGPLLVNPSGWLCDFLDSPIRPIKSFEDLKERWRHCRSYPDGKDIKCAVYV
jgi:hypothetical protein